MSFEGTKEQLSNQLTRLINVKDIQNALDIAGHMNEKYPHYAQGWFLSSIVYGAVSKKRAALAAGKAYSIDVESPKYAINNAKCCLAIGANKEAIVVLDKTLQSGDLSVSEYSEVGRLLSMLNAYSLALFSYTRAVELDSDNYQHYFNLATVYRFIGKNKEAETHLDTAIRLNSDDFEAHHLRSNLRRQNEDSNHVHDLKAALKRQENISGNVYLHYALAKELEDLGCSGESFQSLLNASKLKREAMRYELSGDLQIIDAIQKAYSEYMFDGRINGSEDPAAIFILGMPRTGTTLVERILESHSSVKSAGELNNFAIEMMKLVKSSGLSPASRLDLIDKTTQLNFKQLGDAYIKSVEPLRDGSPRFIDKLPFNYLYAGLIHLAMPNAKIINLQRHPMDTCYSVYKQLFKDAYPFSYDLKELGQYYVAYRELMAHWNTVMPGVIHTVNYEDVVADTEGEARRLLEYCDLPWEDQCMRFYENKSASTTASATQVRQKVYSSSVGKWRHYEKQLQPLADILTAAGIDIS